MQKHNHDTAPNARLEENGNKLRMASARLDYEKGFQIRVNAEVRQLLRDNGFERFQLYIADGIHEAVGAQFGLADRKSTEKGRGMINTTAFIKSPNVRKYRQLTLDNFLCVPKPALGDPFAATSPNLRPETIENSNQPASVGKSQSRHAYSQIQGISKPGLPKAALVVDVEPSTENPKPSSQTEIVQPPGLHQSPTPESILKSQIVMSCARINDQKYSMKESEEDRRIIELGLRDEAYTLIIKQLLPDLFVKFGPINNKLIRALRETLKMGVPLVKPQGSPPGIFERQWLDILNQVGKGYWCQVKSIEMIRLACRSMDGVLDPRLGRTVGQPIHYQASNSTTLTAEEVTYEEYRKTILLTQCYVRLEGSKYFKHPGVSVAFESKLEQLSLAYQKFIDDMAQIESERNSNRTAGTVQGLGGLARGGAYAVNVPQNDEETDRRDALVSRGNSRIAWPIPHSRGNMSSLRQNAQSRNGLKRKASMPQRHDGLKRARQQ